MGVTDSRFPKATISWGFEGWTAQEFDVAADGSTQNVRTVAAYPPAVFVEANQGMLGATRYEPSFRPEGAWAAAE